MTNAAMSHMPRSTPIPVSSSVETMKPYMLESGEQLYSKSGRALDPVPYINTGSVRTANKTISSIDAWLLTEAKREASYEGNDYLVTLLDAIRLTNMSPADRDVMNDVVFGSYDGPTDQNR